MKDFYYYLPQFAVKQQRKQTIKSQVSVDSVITSKVKPIN